MRCSACSTENPPQAKFCLECAAPLARRCSSCDTVLPDAAKFCMECAQPGPGAGATPATSATAPGRTRPRHLADRILASREALEGERKQVTVLFADIVGSTELIRDLDPEDAQALLEPAVRAMLVGGPPLRGDRLPGDGRRHHGAVRGAAGPRGPRRPSLLRRPDHAGRRSAQYGETSPRARGRRGAGAGRAQLRRGGRRRRSPTTCTSSTRRSGRRPTWPPGWSSSPCPAPIQLTAETLRLVEGLVEVQAAGTDPGQGAAPSRSRRSSCSGPARAAGASRPPPTRGLTPFVGRQAELDGAPAGARPGAAGHGQVVAPVGEPGVGKSRLLYEFVHSHRTAGWLVLESGSVSYGKATSYLPVDRPAQELLPDRAARRRPRRPREAGRQAADPRPRAGADPAAAAGPARPAGRRCRLGGAGPAAAAARDPRRAAPAAAA